MTHLAEEELVEAFYGGSGSAEREHLASCVECRTRFLELKEALEAVREYPVPERDETYGAQVWNRLAPKLDSTVKSKILGRWTIFLLAPALATLVAIAFWAGVWTEHQRTKTVSAKVRERVLLMAMSDHLERSQIVLAELLHATPATLDLTEERERARNLVEENRLLRQTALHIGDRSHAALLDDLERVLLDLANSPGEESAEDLKLLQRRVEDDGLLWKVRITSTNARERGEKL
jgi:hypothetical protein